MLIFTSILLIAFGVPSSATADDFCTTRRPGDCLENGPDEPLFSFPDSVEALDKLCPILLPKYKCLSDYKSKCSGYKDLPPKFEIVDNIHDLLVEVCDKDSKAHKELDNHLPCIAKQLKGHYNTCRPLVDEAMVENDLKVDFGDESVLQEDLAKYNCVDEALDMSCFVATTTVKCSEKTGEIVGEVLEVIGLMDAVCPENIREEVKELVGIVQLEMTLRMEMEDYLY